MTTIDDDELYDLSHAISAFHDATRASERRYALLAFMERANPRIVGALIDEYLANAPTNAELDTIAFRLRDMASTLEQFGTQVPETAGYTVVTIALSGRNIRRNGMAFILQDGQEVSLSATFTDARGNPAPVESQNWTSTDEAVLTVTDDGDGNATATAVAVGTAQISLVADARFGEDVSEIRGVLDVEVVAAEAVNAVITPGTPTDAGAGGAGAGEGGGGETPTETGGGDTPPADTGTPADTDTP